jgi:4-hydroxybenzoate polyprenyltransferase
MTALQFAIGALNDVVDAPRDAGRKAGKPIPAGLVSIGEARLVVVWGLAVGLVLAAPSGPATLAVAVAGTSTGLVYDLRLKGTPWAWMAFAVGIPLLPLFAWLGAGGSLPRAFLVLVPVAALAGAAVALGNALVDVDRDRATRTLTPAVVLGEGRAWRALVSLHVIVYLAALVSIPFLGGGVGPGLLLAVIGAAIAALGVGLARGASAATRERGWELQAVGLGVMGAGWVLAVGSVG